MMCSIFLTELRLGHVFKLGTRYSDSLGAKFLDSNGKEQTIIMGSYGIGVNRILAATIEKSHDSNGIIWPLPLAPYEVLVVPINIKDEIIMRILPQRYMMIYAKKGLKYCLMIETRDRALNLRMLIS